MDFNRRMWLRGAAGFTLALPFLPSLLRPGTARAGGTQARRFFALALDHGAVRHSNMSPDPSKLTSQPYAGQNVWRGDLLDQLQVSGGKSILSPVLTADSARLTKQLVGKMNVMRGLDVSFYLGHNRGGHLGNYADNDGNLSGEQGLKHQPTIDQVLAWSKTFYPADVLAGIKERSLHAGGDRMSWNYADPLHGTGILQANGTRDSLSLFNAVFAPPLTKNGRASVTDLVLEDYKRLRGTNQRLSKDDRDRLDDHMQRLSELQRKLKVDASGCGKPFTPAKSSEDVRKEAGYAFDPPKNAEAWQLFNDVIVAAFRCDASRIATMRISDYDRFSTSTLDWHQAVAHLADKTVDPVPQQTMADSRQKIFEGVFVDLMAKLDAIKEGDGTLLDSTLMQFTQESGPSTHTPMDLSVITAGSAGGFLQTGQHLDYRNRDVPIGEDKDGGIRLWPGLMYNQWLGTVLQAMGLSPAEYEVNNPFNDPADATSGRRKGYGAIKLATEGWYPGVNKYKAQLDVMGDVLPFVKKA